LLEREFAKRSLAEAATQKDATPQRQNPRLVQEEVEQQPQLINKNYSVPRRAFFH
jgi:hypothetical protein